MNNYIIKYGLGIFLLLTLVSCDEFIRTEVVKEIYVNKSIINGFVGDEVNLVASPTDGTYQYTWSSEDPSVATVSANGQVKIVGEGFTNIFVASEGIRQKVEIYAVHRIALTDIILSETKVELIPNAKAIINVQRVPDNANDIPNALWTSDNANVATVNEKGEIVGVSEGVTKVRYTIGDIVKFIDVHVSYTKPFNGPHLLKEGGETVIAAADFDIGGPGRAFNDDAANPINDDSYRRSKGDAGSFAVEIEGNGNNLGFVNTGEWYQYTIQVENAGVYLYDSHLSANGVGSYYIDVDGVNTTGSIDVPNNGSWSSWLYNPTAPKEINLTAGTHKVRFMVTASGFNLKALRFRKK
ncbi:carbohydrate-binding protein [Sphingobacterium sp. HJSM2_6]|uniref:carbohydrate-binding protein n=1 Tax=Sphingobacterium sp. HJSM2_6 TaxID=3366264 RepID=UPI003BED3B61